jgi:nitrogen regulatory protein PII
MKNIKKVEIIIEAVYLKKLFKIFKKHKISSYTLIRDIEGKGSHGLMTNDDITDVGTNNYVITAIDEEKFLEMKEEIRSFTKRYGGKCFVTDSMMLL